MALTSGLVDVKVAALDQDWSALKLVGASSECARPRHSPAWRIQASADETDILLDESASERSVPARMAT